MPPHATPAPDADSTDSAGSGHPRAVLIGPPGVGKSTLGRALAEQLGCTFVDTDEEIERSSGQSISDIFVRDGEPAFRTLEAAAVLRAIAQPDGIVALGGGAPMTPAVAAALAQLPVLFLDGDLASVAPRVGLDSPRPLLAVNPRKAWLELMNQRRPVYASLAQHTIDTSGLDADEVLAHALAWVNVGGTQPAKPSKVKDSE